MIFINYYFLDNLICLIQNQVKVFNKDNKLILNNSNSKDFISSPDKHSYYKLLNFPYQKKFTEDLKEPHNDPIEEMDNDIDKHRNLVLRDKIVKFTNKVCHRFRR